MAKGNRKRTNKGIKATIKLPTASEIEPINQQEAETFLQQLVNVSNIFAKLRKQQREYTTIVEKLKENRIKVQKGLIKPPFLMPLSKNRFYNSNSKKDMLDELDSEIKVLVNAIKAVDGQVKQYKDAYIGAGLAAIEFVTTRFGKFKPENVYHKSCQPSKKENIIFEGELDEILKNENGEKQKYYDARKQMKEHNTELKKKEECCDTSECCPDNKDCC